MDIRLISNLNVSGLHAGSGEPILDDLTPPLGLLCLASSLEQGGNSPSIFDLNYSIDSGILKLDKSFYDVAADLIMAQQSSVYAFSTMCNSFHISLRLAEIIRKKQQDAVILFGGPQVSFVAAETLSEFPFVDFVLKGEADDTISVFADALRSSSSSLTAIDGLVYRQSGAIVENRSPEAISSLDRLPVPAWHLFPYDPGDAPSIDVGRGCPFACEFCSTSVFFQRRFRLKSFERIAGEMRYLKARFGSKGVNFVHDLFTANKKWVKAFCEYLETQKDLSDMTWAASARIDSVDALLLSQMSTAGCRGLFYGVESGSKRMQQVIGKRLKIDEVPKIAEVAHASKIACTMSFIAGFPQETLPDLKATFELIARLLPYPGTSPQLHLMSPMVGTPDFKNYRHKLCLDKYFSDIASSAASLIEAEWIEKYPNLFGSFYYFDNDEIDRFLLIEADLFVRLPCTVLRRTISGMLDSDSRLWDLYLEWKEWRRRQASTGSYATELINVVEPDDVILEFAQFLLSRHGEYGIIFDKALLNDEVLAFYLLRYHNVHSAWYISQRSKDSDSADVVKTEGGANDSDNPWTDTGIQVQHQMPKLLVG